MILKIKMKLIQIYEKSIVEIKNKIENTKIIIQNLNNKNDNKNKIHRK